MTTDLETRLMTHLLDISRTVSRIETKLEDHLVETSRIDAARQQRTTRLVTVTVSACTMCVSILLAVWSQY